MPATMLRPKFRRSATAAVGRPSPRAADLTPEQQREIAAGLKDIGGAIIDTVKGSVQPKPAPAPAPEAKRDMTPLIVLALVVGVGVYMLRK
jgi:hypothetical protein